MLFIALALHGTVGTWGDFNLAVNPLGSMKTALYKKQNPCTDVHI